jgi:hypothetical protein
MTGGSNIPPVFFIRPRLRQLNTCGHFVCQVSPDFHQRRMKMRHSGHSWASPTPASLWFLNSAGSTCRPEAQKSLSQVIFVRWKLFPPAGKTAGRGGLPKRLLLALYAAILFAF